MVGAVSCGPVRRTRTPQPERRKTMQARTDNPAGLFRSEG
jgi:hypothetical protein